MKILHIIFSMNTGGTETMLVDIVNGQVSRGHAVELLIINSYVNEALVAGIDRRVCVTRFERREGSMPLLLLARLNMYVLRRRPDVVHLHTYKLTGLLRVMRRRALFTVHCLQSPMIYVGKMAMAAISEAVKADVLARKADADICVIENGIDVGSIAVGEFEKSVPAEFAIVQAGRLAPDIKGQDVLIRALALLRSRGRKARVTLMGGGSAREGLEALAAELGVSEYVEITGEVTRAEIYATLKNYDIMCHPSRHEGFGLTVAEGMCAGLPLVVTGEGGPWEVAGNGAYCQGFATGDAEACAAALERVMDDYAGAMATARRARDYAVERFSTDRQVERYIERYRELAGR